MKSLSTSLSSCKSLLWNTNRDPKPSLSYLLTHTSHYYTNISEDPPSSKLKIFDRHLKRKQRDRAAWLMRSSDLFVDTVAENLVDRLEDCKKAFPTTLSLGGSLQAVRRLLRGRGGIEKLIMMDTSYDTLKVCRDAEQSVVNDSIETSYIIGDEEFLPIAESSLDLIISCLGLHWTNDLPGAMIQRVAMRQMRAGLGGVIEFDAHNFPTFLTGNRLRILAEAISYLP